MLSIYDIVYTYMDTFFPKTKLTKEQKKTIHQEVKKLLNYGWCSSELLSAFKSAKRKEVKRTLHVSRLLRGKKPKQKNLLKQGTFYYHVALQVTSGPPKRSIDYDTGKIVMIDEPFFLEMRASYSVEELVQYFAKQTNIHLLSHEIKRYIGSFNWLLKQYDLQHILFMIDTTVNYRLSNDEPMPDSPLDIQKYKQEALDVQNEKITEAVYSGGNHIVRKKRVRQNRNRS